MKQFFLVISTFITISVRNKFDNIPDQIIKLKNLNYTISNDAYYLKIIGYSDNKDTCYIYTDFYIKEMGYEDTLENRARIWNGGPNGPNKKSTEDYWIKIQEVWTSIQ
jgi:hypothetical protein